jgi:hypothetical protein
MKIFRPLSVFLVAAGAAACSGGEGSTGPAVASVTVSPPAPTLDAVGSTVQFSAQALDAAGKEVTGVAPTWSSSWSSVATISSSGLATAVGDGTTAVTATVDGVSGSTVLTVSVSQSTCDDPTPVTLAAGEFTSFASSDCLLLPSGASGDRYRVTVYRPVGTGDEAYPSGDTLSVKLQVTGVGVTGAPAAPVMAPEARGPRPPIPGLDLEVLDRSLQIENATERLESEMQLRDAALAATMHSRDILHPRRAASLVLASSTTADLPQTMQFDPSTPSSCSTPAGALVTANLIYQNNDMAIYQDSAQQVAKPVSQADAKRMADYSSTYARAMITAYFGQNPDIDNNGKLIVFVSPVVGGNEAGYVWTGNFYTKASCPASNERDMIFFSADLIRAMDDPTPSWQALETVAHEAKHVVSLYDRIAATARAGNVSQFQPTWVEEGTAEISGGMSSRIAWAANGGPGVGAPVTYDDFARSGINQYDYGVALRMYRTVHYLSSQPNALVVTPVGSDPDETIYGSGWHFHAWLGDGYGKASTPMADSSLFRALTDSLTPPGTEGFLQVTGQAFSTLFEQFIAAISLQGSDAPAPAHPFTTYDYVSATNIFQDQPEGLYPWAVTTSGGVLTAGFDTHTYAGPIGRWGMRIHDFVSNGTGTGATIKVTMNPVGRVVVVRLR